MRKLWQKLLPSLALTILIINSLSTNFKMVLKALQIEYFKKHLMTKTILIIAQGPKKFKCMLVRAKFETNTITKLPILAR